MEDKKFLNDDELSDVAGSLADEDDIHTAFNIAANLLEQLSHDKDNNAESKMILGRMWLECMHMSEYTSPSECEVNEVVRRLEELYSSLVNTKVSYIPIEARHILKDLKSNLGL